MNRCALCKLCHWSFDEGLMSVGTIYEVLVSKKVRTEHNYLGHILTQIDRPILKPDDKKHWPDESKLRGSSLRLTFNKTGQESSVDLTPQLWPPSYACSSLSQVLPDHHGVASPGFTSLLVSRPFVSWNKKKAQGLSNWLRRSLTQRAPPLHFKKMHGIACALKKIQSIISVRPNRSWNKAAKGDS